jgi:hypothetical protein
MLRRQSLVISPSRGIVKCVLEEQDIKFYVGTEQHTNLSIQPNIIVLST